MKDGPTPQNRFHPDVAVADSEEVRQEIYRFRYEVYFEECGRDVPGIDHDAKMIRDKTDENIILLYVRKEGQIVGTVRVDLFGEDSPPDHVRDWFGLDQFSDFSNDSFGFSYQIMVAPSWRSSPVTLNLVKACYQIGRENDVKFAFCGASPHLIKLYEAMGFRRYRDNIDVDGHGYQVPFVCVMEDVEYLKRVRSPFLKIAANWENSSETCDWFVANFPQTPGHACERLLDEDDLWSFLSSRLEVDSPLLQGLDEEDVKRLLFAGSVLKCKAGDVVIRQGQVANDMSLILSGAAETRRSFSDGEYPVSFLGAGDVMGALSYDNETARSTDVVALTDLEIVVLTPAVVERALRGRDEAKRTVTNNINRIAEGCLRSWVDALHRVQKAA